MFKEKKETKIRKKILVSLFFLNGMIDNVLSPSSYHSEGYFKVPAAYFIAPFFNNQHIYNRYIFQRAIHFIGVSIFETLIVSKTATSSGVSFFKMI